MFSYNQPTELYPTEITNPYNLPIFLLSNFGRNRYKIPIGQTGPGQTGPGQTGPIGPTSSAPTGPTGQVGIIGPNSDINGLTGPTGSYPTIATGNLDLSLNSILKVPTISNTSGSITLDPSNNFNLLITKPFGLGANPPQAQLHIIQTATNPCLRVDDEASSSNYFFINETGQVKINTTIADTNAENFVVQGSSYFNGNMDTSLNIYNVARINFLAGAERLLTRLTNEMRIQAQGGTFRVKTGNTPVDRLTIDNVGLTIFTNNVSCDGSLNPNSNLSITFNAGSGIINQSAGTSGTNILKSSRFTGNIDVSNNSIVSCSSITRTAGNITIDPSNTLLCLAQLDVSANNIVNAPKVINTNPYGYIELEVANTGGKIILTGTDLESNSAGSSANKYLVVKVNNTSYKIELLQMS